MLASSLAHGLTELALFRVFTGLGIGSLLSSINTIVVEFSSTQRKDFAVSFMSVGYPIGGTIGGTIAVFLIHAFGWRSVFVFGGSCSAVLLPIAFVYLPESLDFLLLKHPRNALARVNALLARMGRPAMERLPVVQDQAENAASSVFSIFDRAFAARTALICSAYFLTMLPFYFVLNWTPKVLVDEGLSLTTGISGSILMNASGVVGGLLFGLLARKLGLQRLGAVYMLMLLASIVAFGFAGSSLPLLMIFRDGDRLFHDRHHLRALCDHRRDVSGAGAQHRNRPCHRHWTAWCHRGSLSRRRPHRRRLDPSALLRRPGPCPCSPAPFWFAAYRCSRAS